MVLQCRFGIAADEIPAVVRAQGCKAEALVMFLWAKKRKEMKLKVMKLRLLQEPDHYYYPCYHPLTSAAVVVRFVPLSSPSISSTSTVAASISDLDESGGPLSLRPSDRYYFRPCWKTRTKRNWMN